MVQKTHCFLSCFDILGFKELRKNRNTEGLYQLYQRHILPSMQHAAAGKSKTIRVDNKNLYVPDININSLSYRIFSDTIVIFTKDTSFMSFLNIVDSSQKILQSGFMGSQSPFRGAIGFGDLIADQNGIIVGSALEDAYIGETRQVWAGCMLTNICKEFIEEKDYFLQFKNLHEDLLTNNRNIKNHKNIELKSKSIVEYNVPLYENPKDSLSDYYIENNYVIDWTINMYKGAALNSFLSHKDNKHAERIINNTIDFENWARKNNR